MLKFNIREINIYQLLFAICILIPFINNYELTFAVWFFTFLITIVKRYSFEIINYIVCFGLILFIAFVVSFFKDESTYNFFRDIAYLLKPILGFLLGYQLYKKFPKDFFKTVIYTGVFLSTIHLVIVIITFIRFQTITVNLLREYCGYHSDFEIYTLIFLIFYKSFELDWNRKNIYLFITIVAVSSFLYLSRTNFIQFVVLFLALKGYFLLNKRSLVIITSMLLIATIGYTIIYNSNPNRNGKGIEAFLYKVKIAPIEPFKTKINKEDWKDFHDNYRSYENILTVKQVNNEGFFGILFGKGLGATINLGRKVWTNDGEYIQYIPILHNGFATIYLKSGLIGLAFLIITIFLIGRARKSEITLVQKLNLLMLGSAIFLIVSNWVFMGVYLKLDNKSILFGFLICYRQFLIQNSNKFLIQN